MPTSTAPNLLSKPQLLQQIQWVADPLGYMDQAAQHYPDLFTANIIKAEVPFVFVSEPKALQAILTSDRSTYAALGSLNRILSPVVGDCSLLLIDGERHKRRRQLLMPAFHGDRIKTYSELIQTITQQVFDQIPVGQPFLARSITQSISLQVILKAVFGVATGDRAQQLQRMLTIISDVFCSPLSSSPLFFPMLQFDWGHWSPWGRFLRDRQRMDDLIYREIRDRRDRPNPDRNDILSMLMATQDETGQPLSDQDLRDELVTLMFAGHETTATALAWALYWVHHLPDVQEKLRHELATADLSDPTTVLRLPYLSAVCNETLRRYPVALLTFPRVVQEPTQLLGHELSRGTAIMGCIYLTHQREDLYPNAQQFQPERFLTRQYTPYEFLPFGGGVRRCIGEALAQLELKLALTTILSRYNLTLVSQKPERAARRGVTLAPASGIPMKRI
jgi:cytochrome P450 family 110